MSKEPIQMEQIDQAMLACGYQACEGTQITQLFKAFTLPVGTRVAWDETTNLHTIYVPIQRARLHSDDDANTLSIEEKQTR